MHKQLAMLSVVDVLSFQGLPSCSTFQFDKTVLLEYIDCLVTVIYNFCHFNKNSSDNLSQGIGFN